MSSKRSGSTIGKVAAALRRVVDRGRPAEADRIRSILMRLFQRNRGREYTFQRLMMLTRPANVEILAMVLDELARTGQVTRVFRVQSEKTMAGLGDFPSLADVPSRLYDRTADEDLEVDPQDIRPIFKTA